MPEMRTNYLLSFLKAQDNVWKCPVLSTVNSPKSKDIQFTLQIKKVAN